MTVWVETDLCDACKLCIKACPYGAIELKQGAAQVLDRCTSCGACLEVCPKAAVLSDVQPRAIPDFSDRQGVWVFAEQRGGNLTRVSLELLGKAQELAEELEHEVSAVLLGHQISSLAETLVEYGADTVYYTDHEILKSYRSNAYTQVIEELINQHKPDIFLMGATWPITHLPPAPGLSS